MTRRDFEELAQILNAIHIELHEREDVEWADIILMFSAQLKRRHPNFDPALFKKACGMHIQE